MLKQKTLITFIAILFISNAHADSPITSTSFYSAYNEIPQIYLAEKEGILNYEFASFLSSGATIDKKVALINALGWSSNGKHNKDLYIKYLNSKYKTQKINYNQITPDEHLCLGYLAIMDDYFHVRESLTIVKGALKRNPKSYTYNIIYGLVLAQMNLRLDSDETFDEDLIDERYIDMNMPAWCNIYTLFAKIESDKTLKQDFRVSAKRNIFKYINLYKKKCSPDDLILIPSTSHLSEIINTNIKLTRKEGIYKIPVKVNDAFTLDFVFDSGASDVLISNDVFSTLVKLDKISKNDILGYEHYQIADGSTVKQITIILRKLQIGEIVVNNVKASVGTSSTPLLLGQSFMLKFKQFTIDNQNGILIIDPDYARMDQSKLLDVDDIMGLLTLGAKL